MTRRPLPAVQKVVGDADNTDVVPPSPLVLVVDDYADTRDLYAYYLTRTGYRVEEAADGHEALRKVTESAPDIILMDLSLPGIDGWTLTRMLKHDAKTAGIPLIVLSAHALQHERQRAWDAGCDAFVAKPCLPAALATEIARVLELTHRTP